MNYRPSKIFGLIGLALLVASTAGAIFALNPNGAARKQIPSQSGTQREPKSGQVSIYGHVDSETGVLALAPLQPGRVVEVPAQENQIVKKGTPLIRVDDRLARNRFLEAEADYKQAKAQLQEIEQAPKQFEAKKAQQQAAVEAMMHRLAAAGHARDRKRQLLKDNLVNRAEVSAAEELVKELEAVVRAEQAKLDELKLIDPQVQVVRAQADLAARGARMAQARYALDECTLTAPTDGEVLQVLASVGSMVGNGSAQPALYFSPSGTMIVRGEVEQEFVGRLFAGQPVSVQDENSVGPSRSGKVVRLADWYTRPRLQSLEVLRTGSTEVRTLECIIALDPAPPTFRLGQRVRVTTGKAPGES